MNGVLQTTTFLWSIMKTRHSEVKQGTFAFFSDLRLKSIPKSFVLIKEIFYKSKISEKLEIKSIPNTMLNIIATKGVSCFFQLYFSS